MYFRISKGVYVTILILTLIIAGVAGARLGWLAKEMASDYDLPPYDMEERSAWDDIRLGALSADKQRLKQLAPCIGYCRGKEDADTSMIAVSLDDLNFWPLPDWFTTEEMAVYATAMYALSHEATDIFIDEKLVSNVPDTVKLLKRNPDVSDVEYTLFSVPNGNGSGYRFHLVISPPAA